MNKHLLALLFAFTATITAKAQYVTIPDTAFVNYLQQYYPACMNGNQMDTTHPIVTSLTELTLNFGTLTDIDGIQYFDSLTDLICWNNHLTALPPLPPLLKTLQCQENQLTTLPDLPSGLEVLGCAYNGITSLPHLPTSLIELNCQNNPVLNALPSLHEGITLLYADGGNLTSLPILPQSLRVLSVLQNHISVLPNYPDSLIYLYIGSNNFSSLSAYPQYLRVLEASGNNITSIAPLPTHLEHLNIGQNQLSALPALPSTLKALVCPNNNITSLPVLPSGLNTLNVEHNMLTGLQTIDSITWLNISHNLFSIFPTLPQNLYYLNCSGNYYTQIPALPPTVTSLYCGSDSLSQITNLNDTMEHVICKNAPNLHCLPKLGYIWQLRLENTGITCLPNYGMAYDVYPPNLTSILPLCDPLINNNCTSYANLAGRVYTDDNNNCILNGNEAGQLNVKQQLFKNGSLEQLAFTGEGGYYSFDTDSIGEYVILTDTTNLTFASSCPVNGTLYDTLTTADSAHFGRDFAWHCRPGFNLVAQSVMADIFRPANLSIVNIHAGDFANFYHSNCAIGISGTVSVTINGPATYISPAANALPPSTVAGNVVAWNVSDFGTVSFGTSFGLVVQTDTLAQMGQQVCFTVKVTPFSGDNDTLNNTLTHCFAVVNSYDPNDKQVYPSGNIDTAQEWLTYTIRFQNTGNAPAQHIHLIDTLDSNVDVSSLELLSYSHQPNIQVKERVVRFNFPYINLPDSNSNEPGSHGYVQYKVKLKEGLPLGTTISNTAYIYFDFNPAVITNTTINTISNDVSIGIIKPDDKGLSINIYPNPANEQINVIATGACQLAIYNAQGSLIKIYSLATENGVLNVSYLTSGVYYIEVKTITGKTARKKFVKL